MILIVISVAAWAGSGIWAYWLMKRFFIKEYTEPLGKEDAWTKKMGKGAKLLVLTGPVFLITMGLFLCMVSKE